MGVRRLRPHHAVLAIRHPQGLPPCLIRNTSLSVTIRRLLHHDLINQQFATETRGVSLDRRDAHRVQGPIDRSLRLLPVRVRLVTSMCMIGTGSCRASLLMTRLLGYLRRRRMRDVAVEGCPRPRRPHPRLPRLRGRVRSPLRGLFDNDLFELSAAMVLGWMMLRLRVESVRRGR